MLITPHNCDGHISMTKQNVAWKGWKVHKFGEVSKGLFTFFFFLHNIKKRKHSSSRSTRSWHKALINNLICVLQQVSTVTIASSSVDFSATESPISVSDTKGLVYSWSLENIRVRCRCRTVAQFSSTLWPWRLNSKLMLWFFILQDQSFAKSKVSRKQNEGTFSCSRMENQETSWHQGTDWPGLCAQLTDQQFPSNRLVPIACMHWMPPVEVSGLLWFFNSLSQDWQGGHADPGFKNWIATATRLSSTQVVLKPCSR